MRIAIATDAWYPQVNGVVRSLGTTVTKLLERGFDIELITPDQFLTLPMPGYREIKLAVAPRFGARRALGTFEPDVVHIVTEGPIGWSARAWCLAHKIPFTSAFHTRFPDYVSVRTGISAERFWPIMRHFHAQSSAVLVSTQRLMDELQTRNIPNTRLWSRGIDNSQFRPGLPPHPALRHLPKPILLSVGRVSKEKNLDAFLGASAPGSKVVVGDGPEFLALQARYPDALLLGALHGEALAQAYAAADVFVFPSRTDTFGLVMIEALACGLPVAAYPVAGPLDVIGLHGRGPESSLDKPVGAVDENLTQAIFAAQTLDRAAAAAYGSSFDWDRCTDQFVAALETACRNGRGRQLRLATN